MRGAEGRVRALLAGALLATSVSFAQAQTVEPRALFPSSPAARARSGEEIARRALDNLFGFDASIRLEIETRGATGQTESSEFLVQRRRLRDAWRLLAVSLRPTAVRGNRVLQINYDDGREETFAYVPAMDGDPVRTRYRLSEPFLATWHPIDGAEEPPLELRTRSEYEVLGLEPASVAGEPAYKLSLRSIVPRGYDRSELFVARSDFAVLETRQYSSRTRAPVLVGVVARADLIPFADRLVPRRIVYRDVVRNTSIQVRVSYASIAESSDPQFFASSFHRVPLQSLDPQVSSEGLP